MSLLGVKGRADSVVHDDQSSPVLRVGVDTRRHGLVEVGWTIGRNGRCGSHGTNDNDGLAAVDSEVHEHCSLFEGIGTVGDNDRVDGGALRTKQVVGMSSEVELDGAVDRGRSNVGDLDTVDVGQVEHFGYSLQMGQSRSQ